ncbi:MAG: HNH endonuclease [Patescibacteria group bacterium]
MSKVKTIILDSRDLRYLLIDNLKIYSDFSFFVDGSNPYHFTINKKSVFIYIRNLHSSGAGRGNSDECRIQINKTDSFFSAQNSPELVFFFGYSDDYGTFTAWNPFLLKKRINEKKTISVYSRFSTQEKAKNQGIALYEDDNKQKVISFRPEYLGLYLENFSKMHESSEKTLLDLIEESDNLYETEAKGREISINSEKFTLTKQRQDRDPNFRKKVYLAYDNRCAFTGIQLDLVEAAHIIPHSHELGVDEIQNGICLSPLHHKAFDSGLVYLDEEYNIKINKGKVEYLEKIGRDGGLKKFSDLQYEKISLPKIEKFNPSKKYIQIANKIRGIM